MKETMNNENEIEECACGEPLEDFSPDICAACWCEDQDEKRLDLEYRKRDREYDQWVEETYWANENGRKEKNNE